ncbi:hypothetical protein BH24ACT5_BH24ACT5_14100 [soil metagenome]
MLSPLSPLSPLVALVALVALVVAAGTGVAAGNCLVPPVEAPVVRGFEAPACVWCAGHRGMSFATAPGTPVVAAAAGTVTFSGIVVDVRYVVVRHGDGLLATYGGLVSAAVAAGDVVAAGAVVGTSGAELYFGLRTGPDTYIDPAPHLGRFVVPPYLVPIDGSPSRPPPPPVLRCA